MDTPAESWQTLLFKGALALCTVGGAVSGVAASKEFAWASAPNMIMLGGVLVAGGVASLMGALFLALRHTVGKTTPNPYRFRHTCAHAGRSDVAGLHALYSQFFGAEAPSVRLMREWIKKCPSSLAILYRVQNESGLAKRLELVGSFKLLPLTKKSVEAVERGHATGSTLTAVHITSSRSKASGFYVGDVVATTATAKGDLLAYLDAALSSIKHDDVAVYARPLTSDGLRVMTGYGFVSITDDRAAPQIGHMCRLYVGGNRTGGRRQRQKRRTSASSADLDADSANSQVTAKTAS